MMLLLFKDPDRHLLEQIGCRKTDILKSELTSTLAPHLILFSYKILMLLIFRHNSVACLPAKFCTANALNVESLREKDLCEIKN